MSPCTPLDEKLASVFPSFLPAATPITHGATEYGLRVFLPGPSLPAAKVIVMPRSWASFEARLIGSSLSNLPLMPQEFEITRMSYFLWFCSA